MTREEEQFLISTMTWSFSRLNSYSTCPYEWHEKYLQNSQGEGSFYADFGSLMHKCIEVYVKGEVPREMLPDVFEALWGEYIQNDLYKDGEVNYAKEEEYYEQGLKYLREQILDLSSYEILGVEKEINFQLTDEEGSYPMIGYIDLLLKDKETGEITIMDNKSASIKFKKNGDPYKADEQHWLEFKRQLYLYSVPFVENGEEISYLSWNLFRLGIVKTIPWNAEEYNEAKKWAIDTIREIEREKEWGYKEDFFYCHNLCSLRGECLANKKDPEDFEW